MSGDQKSVSDDSLEEANKLLEFIGGKKVEKVYRHRTKELAIVFSDGVILFVDSKTDLEFSIQ